MRATNASQSTKRRAGTFERMTTLLLLVVAIVVIVLAVRLR
jgi:hypothetical protein